MTTRSYLTTPIYYVNAPPHFGHAHTTVMADILARARRMAGEAVFVTTGADEHGQKNEAAAKASGLGVEAYLDGRAEAYRGLFSRLGVGYDVFVRTSQPPYPQAVRRAASDLFARGLLVKRAYAGLYCAGCEQFKTASDLDSAGRCPDHPSLTPEALEEENWFLPIEPYRARLRALVEGGDFIQPGAYAGEVMALLRAPLEDLCLSRPKRRVGLGVELPFDADYVAYVWFDALLNYLTSVGWPDGEWADAWAASEHLLGKDVLKTHAVHWPCILFALGLPPPARLRVHGHWLGAGGLKMSKTAGNVVDPAAAADALGVSSLRFFLARRMKAGDSPVSGALLQQSHAELGNKLGNLVLRAASLSRRAFGGVPDAALHVDDAALLEEVLGAVLRAHEQLRALPTIAAGVETLVGAVERLNDHLTAAAPWTLLKADEGRERAASVLYATLDALRLVLEGLFPVMPQACAAALADLGAPAVNEGGHALESRRLTSGGALRIGAPLFPRPATSTGEP